MSATKLIVVPLTNGGNVRAALAFGRRSSMIRNSALQLFCLAEKEEQPAAIIERFGLAPEDLFNAVVHQVCCGEEDFKAAILTAAMRPEVEMLIFPHRAKDAHIVEALAKAVVGQASCPVLLMRLESVRDKPLEQILVPLDCTPSSAVAIEPAVRLAADTGAKLHVLHIATVGSGTDELGSLPIGPYMDQPHYEWPIWVREFWGRFIVCTKETAQGVVPQLHVARGQVDKEIIRFVHEIDCDLVTMTTSAGSNFVHTLMSKLSCPLLLVKPGREQNAELHSAAGGFNA